LPLPQTASPAPCRTEPPRDGVCTLVENLRFAARLALPAGITILVEPVDSATLPASCSHRLDGRRRALDTVGARNISLLYDVGHMHAMGEKVSR